MSLPNEKYRAIRHAPNVMLGIVMSKKNKITKAWRNEIYSALKHYPWPSDKIVVDNYSSKYKPGYGLNDLIKYISLIDGVKENKIVRKK